jgi:hypothetical protein
MRGTYPKTLERKLHILQKGPACSLPACARFLLENFMFLASSAAAAAAATKGEFTLYLFCFLCDTQ